MQLFHFLKKIFVKRFWATIRDSVCVVSTRFAGKYRDTLGSRKESLVNGELNCSESECDSASRRQSFMKLMSLGKLKRESITDRSSQCPEDQPVEEEVMEVVKPREPLSGKVGGSLEGNDESSVINPVV